MLDSHPNISMGSVKEVHYWDNPCRCKQGLGYYAGHFPSIESHGPEPFVSGEATPFYIASREACERISTDMPGTKLVVVLREPVARAYSGYQMEVRRNLPDKELLGLIDLHAERLCSCLLDPYASLGPQATAGPPVATNCFSKRANISSLDKLIQGDNLESYMSAVRACVPEISSNSRWNQLAKSLELKLTSPQVGHFSSASPAQAWSSSPAQAVERLVQKCFPTSEAFNHSCYRQ
ncbi:unnamed protein product [Chrysoparadoxa australica]